MVKNKNYEKSPFMSIPIALAGIYLVIVILFLIFAKDQLRYLIGIIWGFVALGAIAIYFLYKSKQKKKK